MMDGLRYKQVDAFTSRAFAGNPAAVFQVDDGLTDRGMLQIAMEMNLSETAFVGPPDEGGARRLRWFTPAVEVPLCGHATLATGHVLFEEGAATPIRFATLSGELVVHREEDGAIRMDFPADVPEAAPVPQGLPDALACDPEEFLCGSKGVIVRVADEAAVRAVQPDIRRLMEVDVPDGVLVLSVTAPADEPNIDFASRVFAPWAGIDEDPVTGAAHTSLAPYWTQRLGRNELEARQVSARGGELRLRWLDERVHLIGQAVTVAEGTLLRPT